MWMKTSHFQSVRPASSTSTRWSGSALSRFASAQPAEPPPTMMKSYPAGSATQRRYRPSPGPRVESRLGVVVEDLAGRCVRPGLGLDGDAPGLGVDVGEFDGVVDRSVVGVV